MATTRSRKRPFTTEEKDYITQLKKDGLKWDRVEVAFNSRFPTRTVNALRDAFYTYRRRDTTRTEETSPELSEPENAQDSDYSPNEPSEAHETIPNETPHLLEGGSSTSNNGHSQSSASQIHTSMMHGHTLAEGGVALQNVMYRTVGGSEDGRPTDVAFEMFPAAPNQLRGMAGHEGPSPAAFETYPALNVGGMAGYQGPIDASFQTFPASYQLGGRVRSQTTSFVRTGASDPTLMTAMEDAVNVQSDLGGYTQPWETYQWMGSAGWNGDE